LSFVANAFNSAKAAAAPLHPHPIQVPFALTAIRGLGRRFTTLACKKAGVNVHKRYSQRATCHALHARASSRMPSTLDFLPRFNISAAQLSFSAGELKPAEIDKVLDVIAKPEDYKVGPAFEIGARAAYCLLASRRCCAV
jgi:hypothetical protein